MKVINMKCCTALLLAIALSAMVVRISHAEEKPVLPLLTSLINAIDEGKYDPDGKIKAKVISLHSNKLNMEQPVYISAEGILSKGMSIVGVSAWSQNTSGTIIPLCNILRVNERVEEVTVTNGYIPVTAWNLNAEELVGCIPNVDIGKKPQIIRVGKDGKINNDENYSPTVISLAVSADNEILVTDRDKIIDRIKLNMDDGGKVLCVTGYIGDAKDGLFGYATGNIPESTLNNAFKDIFRLQLHLCKIKDHAATDFIIKELTAKELMNSIGNPIGVFPERIAVSDFFSVDVADETVYLPLSLHYKENQEKVNAFYILKIGRQLMQVIDVVVEYRNMKNPVLNANWWRSESGGYVFAPSSVRNNHVIPGITSQGKSFVVNGGWLWELAEQL